MGPNKSSGNLTGVQPDRHVRENAGKLQLPVHFHWLEKRLYIKTLHPLIVAYKEDDFYFGNMQRNKRALTLFPNKLLRIYDKMTE